MQFKVIEDDSDMLYFKYSYSSDYKNYKFKTINTRSVEMNKEEKSAHAMQKGINC